MRDDADTEHIHVDLRDIERICLMLYIIWVMYMTSPVDHEHKGKRIGSDRNKSVGGSNGKVSDGRI